MPDFRFVSTKATVQPSSGYATRISQSIWSQHEELVRRLHACGTTRDDILRTLIEEHDFQPTVGQLRDQIARWGLKSTRRHKTQICTTSDDVSSDTFSGSDGPQADRQSQPATPPAYIYAPVPDAAFDSMWPQYELGTLQYGTAVEMEVLADTLFLGGRYVAAFNLYFSIYHAASVSPRYNSVDLATTRFRTLIGCLRSSGNTKQRQQIVSIAEREEQAHFCGNYCRPDEVVRFPESNYSHLSLMVQFHKRESFRHTMSAVGDGATVSEIVTRLYIDDGREMVLDWCFSRINTSKFISLYDEHVRKSGSGVACWSFGGSRNVIYWFLVVDAMSWTGTLPCFTIRHASGLTYTSSPYETFALVAAMISSEPWLFSQDRLPPIALRKWTETLLLDNSLFDTIFQAAIKTTLVPNFNTRITKMNSDALAFANGHPSYHMPNVGILKDLAAQMSQSTLSNSISLENTNAMETDAISPISLMPTSFENLVHQYSRVIESYINENCAYDTSYQLRERPKKQSQNCEALGFKKPFTINLRSFSEATHLNENYDPMLTSPMRGSRRSSFRSFQSTHSRSKKVLTWRELETMSIDTNDSCNFNQQWPMSLGVT